MEFVCAAGYSSSGRALPELLVEGFQDEQIWQQLELQNEWKLRELKKRLRNSLLPNYRLPPSTVVNDEVKTSDRLSTELCDEEEKIVEEEDEPEEKDVHPVFPSSTGTETVRKERSVVDDDFFNLREMESFLISEETKEMEELEQEAEDSGVDHFRDISDDDSTQEEMGYSAFFDPPDSDVSPEGEDLSGEEEYVNQ